MKRLEKLVLLCLCLLTGSLAFIWYESYQLDRKVNDVFASSKHQLKTCEEALANQNKELYNTWIDSLNFEQMQQGILAYKKGMLTNLAKKADLEDGKPVVILMTEDTTTEMPEGAPVQQQIEKGYISHTDHRKIINVGFMHKPTATQRVFIFTEDGKLVGTVAGNTIADDAACFHVKPIYDELNCHSAPYYKRILYFFF